MKKFMVVMLSLAVLMVFAAGSVCAKGQPGGVRAVFEADIVADSIVGVFGEAYVRLDGSFKVEVKGVAADETYTVTLLCNSGETSLGALVTDSEGEGKLEGAAGTISSRCSGAMVRLVPATVDGTTYYTGFDLSLP